YSGAHPSDAFYGELSSPYGVGGWSDATVTADPDFRQSKNVPGDGKFDQENLPSPMEVGVGRVDLYHMPGFGVNEATLIARYLDKDHDFRCGNFSVQRRAVLAPDSTGPFRISRTPFDAILGAANVTEYWTAIMHWFPNVSGSGQDYLIGYGGGWGSGDAAYRIGTTFNRGTANDGLVNSQENNFADFDSRVVFVNLYGSYF